MTEETKDAAVDQEAPHQNDVGQTVSQLPATIGRVAITERGYVSPTNAEEAYELARMLSNIAGSSFQNNISKIATAILAGQEAGLGPVYSVRNIAIINGNPTMYGDALMALVQASGMLEKLVKRQTGLDFDIEHTPREKWPDGYGWQIELHRRKQEEPYRGKFTVGDARRAGLWTDTRRKPWFEYPDRMLYRRALAFPVRDGFADVLAGLTVREEVEDYSVGTGGEKRDLTPLLADDAGQDETPPETIEDAVVEEVEE